MWNGTFLFVLLIYNTPDFLVLFSIYVYAKHFRFIHVLCFMLFIRTQNYFHIIYDCHLRFVMCHAEVKKR